MSSLPSVMQVRDFGKVSLQRQLPVRRSRRSDHEQSTRIWWIKIHPKVDGANRSIRLRQASRVRWVRQERVNSPRVVGIVEDRIPEKIAQITISTILSRNSDWEDRARTRMDRGMAEEQAAVEGDAVAVVLSEEAREVLHRTTARHTVASRTNTEMRAGSDDSTRSVKRPNGPKTGAMTATEGEAGIRDATEEAKTKVGKGDHQIAETEAAVRADDGTTTGGGMMARRTTDGGTIETGIGDETMTGKERGIDDDDVHCSPCTTMYQMHDAQMRLDGRDGQR